MLEEKSVFSSQRALQDMGVKDFIHIALAFKCAPNYNQVGTLLVGFVALRPKSTAMVIAGRSVHLTTLFPGQALTSG